MSFGLFGSELVTLSKTVGRSGYPFRLTGISILSGGTASVASSVTIRNGTTASDTIWIEETGTGDTSKSIDYGSGVLLTSGCFISTDANTTSVVVSGRTEAK